MGLVILNNLISEQENFWALFLRDSKFNTRVIFHSWIIIGDKERKLLSCPTVCISNILSSLSHKNRFTSRPLSTVAPITSTSVLKIIQSWNPAIELVRLIQIQKRNSQNASHHLHPSLVTVIHIWSNFALAPTSY